MDSFSPIKFPQAPDHVGPFIYAANSEMLVQLLDVPWLASLFSVLKNML